MFSDLSNIEKGGLLLVIVILIVLLLDRMRKFFKERQASRMLQDYLNFKENKLEELLGLLVDEKNITVLDIKKRLEIDLTQFDSRYRDLLYHELIKIRANHTVNAWNWKVFVRILRYNPNK